MVLAILCVHAYLAVTAAHAKRGTGADHEGLISPALGEIRRLPARLITTTRPSTTTIDA
ncbi:hypothetical protein Vwe01_63460 [Micromonospora andamanensis]|nr:hypothetical protein Vwe01_63460 [Micromonospora andamanensis]